MFGPNPKTKIINFNKENYSHRDEKFKEVYCDIKNILKDKFSLKDFDIVLITGPATLAIESIIDSLEEKIKVEGVEGKFKNRWKSISEKTNLKKTSNKTLKMGVHFETSNSTFNNTNEFDIIDAVSSFPFIEIKEKNKIIVTTANKILGSLAGISIVFLRKDAKLSFKKRDYYSYLDFLMHINYSLENQTPCTSCLHTYETLRNELRKFDKEKVKKKIELNCKIICKSLEIENKFLPAITIEKNKCLESVLKKYSLYGYNDIEKSEFQIFTYSESSNLYRRLSNDLKEAKKC